MKTIINYFKEAWTELGKVTWPSRAQTIKLTVAVMVFSAVIASFISLVDVGLNALVKRLIIG
ncbi:preprotein translocase subunit SecE [Candidatus Microgenomates bacterium]|nr:preprotein translocase subunit SecE [Candidatus Microgenomates bacterium]